MIFLYLKCRILAIQIFKNVYISATMTIFHHQHKQQAIKCLLFLYFSSLSAVSDVPFSKIAVFGKYSK